MGAGKYSHCSIGQTSFPAVQTSHQEHAGFERDCRDRSPEAAAGKGTGRSTAPETNSTRSSSDLSLRLRICPINHLTTHSSVLNGMAGGISIRETVLLLLAINLCPGLLFTSLVPTSYLDPLSKILNLTHQIFRC